MTYGIVSLRAHGGLPSNLISPAWDPSIVSVFDVSMVAPDLICLEIRDSKCIKGNIVDYSGVSQGTYYNYVSKTNPATGGTEIGVVIGRNTDFVRFSDKAPTSHLVRATVDSAANYSGSSLGGRTVTNVYRISKPVDTAQCYLTTGTSTTQDLAACFHHWIYLKLSGNLATANGLTLVNSAFPTVTFNFNDTVTRSPAIHATQVGHRASDGEKLAYLSHWVPGFGTEGRMDYSAFTTFEVIDASGTAVFTGTPALRNNATTADDGVSLAWYPSTTTAPKKITAINNATSTATCNAHGFVTGQHKMLRGMSDGNLEQRVIQIGTTTANTFVMLDQNGSAINMTGYNAYADNYDTGFNNLVYDAFQANRSLTNVYSLDYSTWTSGTPGTYRIRVPGIGVSYPFNVGENVHYLAAKASMKGYYNQFLGIALDPSIGDVTRPIAFKDGVNGVQVFLSKLPAICSAETNIASGISVETPNVGNAARWITTTRMTGWTVSWQDAGDCDQQLIAHCYALYSLLEFGHEALPSGVKNNYTFGFPKMTTLLNSTTYAGTNGMSDAVHMAAVYLDQYRLFQDASGWVPSAVQYTDIGGAGGDNRIPTYLANYNPIVLSADHLSNYYYALAAAKLGQVFTDGGFTTLGTLWRNSAVAAWDWAEALFQDYAANGTAGTTFDAWYGASGLNLKANMNGGSGWTSGQYTAAMDNVQSRCGSTTTNQVGIRGEGAAMLYRSTGNFAKYGTIIYSQFAVSSDLARQEFIRSTDLPSRTGAPGNGTVQIAYYSGTDGNNQGFTNSADQTYPSAFAASGQITSYKTAGINPFFNNSSPDVLIRGFNFSTSKTATNKYLKLIHTATDFIQGANQEGMCCTTGLGTFFSPNPLHRDREAMGLTSAQWPGITTYTWWQDNTGGIFSFAFGRGSDFNFTIDCPPVGASPDPKLIEPYYRAVPPMQAHWASTFNIFNTEFTTEQNIVPMFLFNLWRWCWDGNVATTP